MPRLACRLLSLLAVVLLMWHAPIAQTRAQNDKAAADAVKNKGLPLITGRPVSFPSDRSPSPGPAHATGVIKRQLSVPRVF